MIFCSNFEKKAQLCTFSLNVAGKSQVLTFSEGSGRAEIPFVIEPSNDACGIYGDTLTFVVLTKSYTAQDSEDYTGKRALHPPPLSIYNQIIITRIIGLLRQHSDVHLAAESTQFCGHV
jgi:hypothetical protein